MHYIRIPSSFTDSSAWQQPSATRIVWITMLLLADPDGIIGINNAAIAGRANVTIRECEDAIRWLASPDEKNNGPGSMESEGRHIVDVQYENGAHMGWRILGFAAYSYNRTR